MVYCYDYNMYYICTVLKSKSLTVVQKVDDKKEVLKLWKRRIMRS